MILGSNQVFADDSTHRQLVYSITYSCGRCRGVVFHKFYMGSSLTWFLPVLAPVCAMARSVISTNMAKMVSCRE